MNKFLHSLSIVVAGGMLLSCTACDSATKTADTSNTTDASSQEIVSAMTCAWNLGDTLDVCQADRDGDGLVNETAAPGEEVDETLWGNPKVTQELFDHLQDEGINAVRIPVTWRDHYTESDGVYTISTDWLAHVEEVVNYAYNAGMYVIINVHHDGGGDPDFGAWIRTDEENFPSVEEQYQQFWTQIATYFNDYDEHLIFESMNEVGFDNVSGSKKYEMLNTLNQDFVDIVRDSGGNNDKRHLLIAGYWTDIDETCKSDFQMPTDSANRCILSVHYYTPYQFCITGENTTWGTDDEIAYMQQQVEKLQEHFVSQGIPVIVGEFGMSMAADAESRLLFTRTFVKLCHENQIAAFFWDNGEEYDRTNYVWRTEGMGKAIAGEDV